MNTRNNNQSKLKLMFKSCFFAVLMITAINISEARVSIGIGVGGYPYYPSYYSCVPSHWEYGYWVQGNCGYDGYDYYDNYSYSTGPAFIFGFGGGGHHHHGGGWGGGGWHHGGGGGGWHGGGGGGGGHHHH